MQNQPYLTEYELQRAARIAANKQRMEELGVLQAAQQLNQLNRPQNTMRWRKPSTAKPRPPPSELVATRASKRIRGEPVAAAAQVCLQVSEAGTCEGLLMLGYCCTSDAMIKFDRPCMHGTCSKYGSKLKNVLAGCVKE
jgi:hypothetical protein